MTSVSTSEDRGIIAIGYSYISAFKNTNSSQVHFFRCNELLLYQNKKDTTLQNINNNRIAIMLVSLESYDNLIEIRSSSSNTIMQHKLEDDKHVKAL